jgi:hypothetical protein
VEDVDVYFGSVSESTGKNLFDSSDDQFKWVYDGTTTTTKDKDTTTANKELPKTGYATIGISLAVSMTFAIIAYVSYKKLNIK